MIRYHEAQDLLSAEAAPMLITSTLRVAPHTAQYLVPVASQSSGYSDAGMMPRLPLTYYCGDSHRASNTYESRHSPVELHDVEEPRALMIHQIRSSQLHGRTPLEDLYLVDRPPMILSTTVQLTLEVRS